MFERNKLIANYLPITARTILPPTPQCFELEKLIDGFDHTHVRSYNFENSALTHFMQLVSFYTHYNHQKIKGFPIFSGGIKRDQWHEIGWSHNSFSQNRCIYRWLYIGRISKWLAVVSVNFNSFNTELLSISTQSWLNSVTRWNLARKETICFLLLWLCIIF